MYGTQKKCIQNFWSEKLKERKHLEDEAHAYSTHSLWVACYLAKLCYVACRDILDEKMSFNRFVDSFQAVSKPV